MQEIEHHDVVCLGTPSDAIADKTRRAWKRNAMKALEEAAELYMIEVDAVLQICSSTLHDTHCR